MPYGPEDLRQPDAPSTLELALAHTRAGAEAIRRGGGLFATTSFAAEVEAFRRFAEKHGLNQIIERLSDPPDTFGYEHEVWFPPDGEQPARVLKATFGNCFGHLPDGSEGTPVGYLQRLILQNEVFGDDIRLESFCETRPGVYQTVTSQPAIEGRPAEQEEIRVFFLNAGFRMARLRGKPVWYREEDRIACSDTHGGNLLMTKEGRLIAIDVPAMFAASDDIEPLEEACSHETTRG